MTMGEKIRRYRKGRGWTLDELSKRSGLAISTISKAERGQLSLTFDRFINLTEALELDVSDLFDDLKPSIGADGIAIHRSGGGPTHEAGNYHYRMLCSDLRNKHMVPMAGSVKSGDISDFDHYGQHPGEEFIYVLEGVLEVHLKGRKKIILEPGDSIYFNSEQPHIYIASKESKRAHFLALNWQPQTRDTVQRTIVTARDDE